VLLIEPTATEDKQTLDGFVEALVEIQQEAVGNPEQLKGAPLTLPVRRLDDVRAARELGRAWQAAGRTNHPVERSFGETPVRRSMIASLRVSPRRILRKATLPVVWTWRMFPRKKGSIPLDRACAL
jgi:hypothetical protein